MALSALDETEIKHLKGHLNQLDEEIANLKASDVNPGALENLMKERKAVNNKLIRLQYKTSTR